MNGNMKIPNNILAFQFKLKFEKRIPNPTKLENQIHQIKSN